jgi:hypothetical protein
MRRADRYGVGAFVGSRLAAAHAALDRWGVGQLSKQLEKARELLAAGQYKRAVNLLWERRNAARVDPAEAQTLLELATALADKTDRGLRDECNELADDARRFLGEPDDQVALGSVSYLGGCSQLGSARPGRLALSPAAIVFERMQLDMAAVESVELAGGEVAKSRVGATLVFGLAGLATKGTQDRTEMAVHLRSGESAFFVLEDASPFAVRAKIQPVLKSAGIPFKEAADEPGPSQPHSLADELAKLADLHDRGVLTDDELAVAKTKLLS